MTNLLYSFSLFWRKNIRYAATISTDKIKIVLHLEHINAKNVTNTILPDIKLTKTFAIGLFSENNSGNNFIQPAPIISMLKKATNKIVA